MTMPSKDTSKPVTIYYTTPRENPDNPIRTFFHFSTLGHQSKGPKGPGILTVLYRLRGELRPYRIGELKSLWNLTEGMIAQYENNKAVTDKPKTKKTKSSVSSRLQAIKEVL